MSTTTVRRPKETETAKLLEWRRVCHRYDDDSQRSICGLGTRKPGEGHYEDECNARGHTICVVCNDMLQKLIE